MKKITDILNMALPHQDAVVKSLETEKTQLYSSEKGFRNAMLAGNIIILLITLMGLLGYTVTEVSRRSKELAIRKISGARLSDILNDFHQRPRVYCHPGSFNRINRGMVHSQ